MLVPISISVTITLDRLTASKCLCCVKMGSVCSHFFFFVFFFSFSFVHGASLLSLSTWCIITYVEAATPCFG